MPSQYPITANDTEKSGSPLSTGAGTSGVNAGSRPMQQSVPGSHKTDAQTSHSADHETTHIRGSGSNSISNTPAQPANSSSSAQQPSSRPWWRRLLPRRESDALQQQNGVAPNSVQQQQQQQQQPQQQQQQQQQQSKPAGDHKDSRQTKADSAGFNSSLDDSSAMNSREIQSYVHTPPQNFIQTSPLTPIFANINGSSSHNGFGSGSVASSSPGLVSETGTHPQHAMSPQSTPLTTPNPHLIFGARTDNASILTIASSSKDRRRSFDTNASMRVLVAESIRSEALDSNDTHSLVSAPASGATSGPASVSASGGANASSTHMALNSL